MSSINTIKGTQNQESESLVPVGLGTYVKAVLQGNSKIVVDVGAGIAVEKDHNSAINYLESRIKELQVALNETNAQKHETMVRLEQLKEQMNHLMQSVNPSQK